jgi:hypothetical protein
VSLCVFVRRFSNKDCVTMVLGIYRVKNDCT